MAEFCSVFVYKLFGSDNNLPLADQWTCSIYRGHYGVAQLSNLTMTTTMYGTRLQNYTIDASLSQLGPMRY